MNGIQSYKHLDEIVLKIMKKSDKELTAAQINDKILNTYRTGKIHLSARSISKRLRGVPHVKTVVARPYRYSYEDKRKL